MKKAAGTLGGFFYRNIFRKLICGVFFFLIFRWQRPEPHCEDPGFPFPIKHRHQAEGSTSSP
jgi:hypothetical protein